MSRGVKSHTAKQYRERRKSWHPKATDSEAAKAGANGLAMSHLRVRHLTATIVLLTHIGNGCNRKGKHHGRPRIHPAPDLKSIPFLKYRRVMMQMHDEGLYDAATG